MLTNIKYIAFRQQFRRKGSDNSWHRKGVALIIQNNAQMEKENLLIASNNLILAEQSLFKVTFYYHKRPNPRWLSSVALLYSSRWEKDRKSFLQCY